MERKEAVQQALERQQREACERGRKEELSRRREAEQQEITALRAKKKKLQMELENVGSRHKQLSDRLRDAQTKRRIQRAELDLVNQRRDGRASEINSLQIQFEDYQRKLSQLVPQQQRLTERLLDIKHNHIPAVAMTSVNGIVAEKGVACRKLKDQLDALERETTDKLAMMGHYQQDIKELRERQGKQQAVLEDLCKVKELKLREMERRTEEEIERKRSEEEEIERKRREEEEAARQANLEQQRKEERRRLEERREEERREEERREEEKRQQLHREKEEENWTRLQEQQANQREKEEWEEKERLRAAQGQAEDAEKRRCQEEEEKKRIADRLEGGESRHPVLNAERSSTLTSYRALYPFTARSTDELSLDADCLIEVDDETVGEPGWLCGSYHGKRGWFPESYAERCPALPNGPAAPGHTLLPPSCPSIPPSLGLPDEEAVRAGRSPSTEPSKENYMSSEPIYSTVAELDCPEPLQLEEFVALYTYESPEAGDLTFSEGDVVMVTEREGEWWRGCIGDQTGVFPSNYVKPMEPEITRPGAASKKPEIAQSVSAVVALMTEQLSLSPGQLIVVLAKNSNGWWLGELQARGKKRQRGWFHSSYVKLLGPTSMKNTPAPVPVCQVIAKYDYKAANQDEMSFFKGELINVLDKDNPDWWKGEVNGVTGLLPTNYVTMTTDSDPAQQCSLTPSERRRQCYIYELIHTEQTYLDDLELVMEVFYQPMSDSGYLTEEEMLVIFMNWRELILCNRRLLKALRALEKEGGVKMSVQLLGEMLSSEVCDMNVYVRFCSHQLSAVSLLQDKTNTQPGFKHFLKTLASDHRCKGMTLCSFFLKPIQRITRYPLLMKNCEGVLEHLVFNSPTNCLGPRKLLHSGLLHKAKNTRELWVFLFNDFLLLTQPSKPFSSNPLSLTSPTRAEKLFSHKNNTQLKMYKLPLFLNEVMVKMPSDQTGDEVLFHISHIDRIYTLKTNTINERATWVQRIKAASEHFIETEKKKREKAYQARSLQFSGVGRLTVTVIEAQGLKACKPNARSCPGQGRVTHTVELTMGDQGYTSRPLSDTLNPKWNFICQFFIQDLLQDVLNITVSHRDLFAPDNFLGSTAVPLATVQKVMDGQNWGHLPTHLGEVYLN
ncbi:hypothetical protein UPYG_G00248170 [Umbra pygmaea]|uniref:Uncharacterized protein n=1 Tax=Umbra pygmaea TaxID=75934 RepID=A0ABD0WQR3_UMBPY